MSSVQHLQIPFKDAMAWIPPLFHQVDRNGLGTPPPVRMQFMVGLQEDLWWWGPQQPPGLVAHTDILDWRLELTDFSTFFLHLGCAGLVTPQTGAPPRPLGLALGLGQLCMFA